MRGRGGGGGAHISSRLYIKSKETERGGEDSAWRGGEERIVHGGERRDRIVHGRVRGG